MKKILACLAVMPGLSFITWLTGKALNEQILRDAIIFVGGGTIVMYLFIWGMIELMDGNP